MMFVTNLYRRREEQLYYTALGTKEEKVQSVLMALFQLIIDLLCSIQLPHTQDHNIRQSSKTKYEV